MIVSRIREWVMFRSSFNEEYDIVHQFTNIIGAPISRNGQVDFLSSALTPKVGGDSWNAPIILSSSSDEAPPCVINGAFIGGGHGQPCCVTIHSPMHNKTLKDLGAVYTDDDGVRFTIVEIENEDYVKVVSENIGESEVKYNFKLEIAGKLKFLSDGCDKSDIIIEEQFPRTYLSNALRHRRRQVVVYKDGKAKTLLNSCECDYGEIQESYDIINPATIAPALTSERPDGGYKHLPMLSDFGKPMVSLDHKFIITPDGTIIVDFVIKKLMDVRLDNYMGVMYQEKRNVYGGGIHRVLCKVKPITTEEGTFDFSKPYPLRGAAFPNHIVPGREYWANPDSPFDRIVDYFRDIDGKDKLGFSCGYLPVYDGHPNIRKNIVDSLMLLYKTRKAYPYFISGDKVKTAHGVCYKKFFTPEQRSSVYSIPFEDKKYIYFDIFENTSLSFKTSGEISLFEKDGDLTYKIENGIITVSGNKGFAVFIEE